MFTASSYAFKYLVFQIRSYPTRNKPAYNEDRWTYPKDCGQL